MRDFNLFLEAADSHKKIKPDKLNLSLVSLFVKEFGIHNMELGRIDPPSVIGRFKYFGNEYSDYILIGDGMYEALSEMEKWGNLTITDNKIFDLIRIYTKDNGYKTNLDRYGYVDQIKGNEYKKYDLIFYNQYTFGMTRKGVISKDAEILEDLRDYASNVRRIKKKGTADNIKLIKEMFPGMNVQKRSTVGSFGVWDADRFADFIIDIVDDDKFSVSYMHLPRLSGKDLEKFIELVNR